MLMLLQKKLSFYDENNHVKNTKTDMNNSHIDMVQRQPSSQTKCSNLEENLLHGEGKKNIIVQASPCMTRLISVVYVAYGI